MAELKQALQSLSVVLIVSAVLESVLPPSKGKRAFHLLCGVVIFAALISSFGKIDFQKITFDELLPTEQESEQQTRDSQTSALLLAAETGYASAAENALRQADVPFSKIKGQCAAQDETFTLKQLTAAGVPETFRAAARKALSQLCGQAQIQFVTEEAQ